MSGQFQTRVDVCAAPCAVASCDRPVQTRPMAKRIGITLGDCAGIGPEIVHAALDSGLLTGGAEYKIIGKYPDCPLGRPTPATAKAAAAALEEAATLGRRGEIDAIVTAPIHKARMYEIGFRFPGQ